MKTAKLFMNGRSQAVRLPKEFRFDADEVYIEKTAKGVILMPKKPSLKEIWEKTLWARKEICDIKRYQPKDQQEREGLDGLFT